MVDVAINVGEIEYWPVSRLTADPRNVKRHPETQLRQIIASIERFGDNDPITVDQDGVICAGHGHLEAVMRMGRTEVPVTVVEFASEAERRAYAIAHNQTQNLSPMDNAAVLYEFSTLGVSGDDYQALGFTPEDVTFMQFERGGSASTDDDDDQASPGSARPQSFSNDRVIRSMLKFDTQEQLFTWYRFLEWLRDRYPDAQTIAERLALFVEDFGAQA